MTETYIFNSELELSNYEERFFIKHKFKNKVWEINASIHDFLLLFVEKTNKKDATSKFIIKYNSYDIEKLERLFDSFFENMTKVGFVVKFRNFSEYKENIVIDNNEEIIYESSKSVVSLIAKDQRKLIIKRIKSKSQTKKLEELENEYKILKHLGKNLYTPNLVDFNENEKILTIEFLEGKSLSKFIEKDIRLNKLKLIFSNILKGFKFLYDNNVIHGDIHFNNIIVCKYNRIKIIDFGLSYFSYSTPKKTGGVNFFLPPERIQRNCFVKFSEVSTEKSEIYQISLLLYILIAKKKPFSSEKWSDLYDEIKKGIDINHLLINEPIKTFLKKGLAVEPNDRFNNFSDMQKQWDYVKKHI